MRRPLFGVGELALRRAGVKGTNVSELEKVEAKETARLEAFSDGVFAVAITLLLLELKSPVLAEATNHGLLDGLREKWPEYVAVATSFASVLTMWLAHHDAFKIVKAVKKPLLLANGLLLFMVMMQVYSTKIVSAYLGTGAASAAAAFYSGTSFLLCSSFALMWQVATKDPATLVAGTNEKDAATKRANYWLGTLIYVAAIPLAFVSPWISIAIIDLSLVFWIVRTPD
jgi:uncharacterized membrane protein